MTNGEICEMYRSSKNKTSQIKILAELNAVPEEKIREILSEGGYEMSVKATLKNKPVTNKIAEVETKPAAVEKKKAEVEQKPETVENAVPVIEKLEVPQLVKDVLVRKMVEIQEEIDEKMEELKVLSQFMEKVRGK